MAPNVEDTAFSLRFKYGVHTILVFVDSLQPFSEISTQLLEILRDRFPNGLTASHSSPETTPLPPDGTDVRIAYALPVNANDLAQGWKDLRISGDETPVRKGLKDNIPVAFAFVPEGDDSEEVEFVVDIPSFEDAYEEEIADA